jgi:hypothetical protein
MALPRLVNALLSAFALVVGILVAVVGLGGPAAATGTVTVTVQGQGTVTGDGISCSQSGGDCSELYEDEQFCDPELKPPCHDVTPTVELTAGTGTNGFVFDHFDGCTSASGSTCSITVNSSKSITAVYRDNQAPSVSVSGPSAGAKRHGTVTVSATASDNVGVAGVQFFRGGSVALASADTSAPYEASFDTTSVGDGPVTLTARAVDASGLASTSSGIAITVDNTAPSLSVTGPNGQSFTSGTTQSWTIAASDLTTGPPTVQCSVVATGTPPSFGPCSGGGTAHSVSNLPEGSYSLVVRATDEAGNVTEAARSFTIDATPPDTSLTSGPAASSVVTTRTVTLGFSATEGGSTFQCRLYPSGITPPAFAPCSSPASHTASGLADGGYRFEVRGVDAVGNADGSPAVRDFAVDATAPRATITKQPPSKVKTKKKKVKVAFSFAADDPGATFRCRLDGAAFMTCPATISFTVKPGRHSLEVVAVDAAGNVQAPPATSSFAVKRIKKRH